MSEDYYFLPRSHGDVSLRRIADALEQIVAGIDTAKGDAVAGALEVAANEVEAMDGTCHSRSGLGCDDHPCSTLVRREDVLAIIRRP